MLTLILMTMLTLAFNVQPIKTEGTIYSVSGDFMTQSGVDDWPMFHHDLSHTGYSTSTAPNTNNVLWSYRTGTVRPVVFSSPAVADGKVYVGSDDGKVYCLDAIGNGDGTTSVMWNYTTGDSVFSSPAVADGKVYVGSTDGNVYCLYASIGAKFWSYTTDVTQISNSVYSSPAVADGKVYAGSYDHCVYCLDASTGTKIWSYTTSDWVHSSPAVADGKVYAGSTDGNVYAFGAQPIYDVTIEAYCYTEGTPVSVDVTMDGTPTGFNTPHTFTGLTGSHTFAVQDTDLHDHPFKQWNTGETSTTITVTTGGTYTAYYEETSWPVRNINTGLDYETIQEAIDAPETLNGHTIRVDEGIYYENVTVDKSLSLIGEDKFNTIIDGSGTGNVINITADNVNINGFKIRNSGTYPACGIYVFSSDNNISYNIIAHNYYGIKLSDSSNNTISGNDIYGAETGICLFSSSNNNSISGNNITANNWDGIYLSSSSSNSISGNDITNNWHGIQLDWSSYNTISGNNITNNEYGIRLTGSSNNSLFHNNFVNNTAHTYVTPGYIYNWDDGYPSGGNYWDDYTGVDEKSGPNQDEPGSDGIGDTPYVIDEDNQDNYPLMEPWVNIVTIIDIVTSKTATNDTIVYATVIMEVPTDYRGRLEVSAYYNSTLIATKNSTLLFPPLATFPFRLNTTLMPKGVYLLSANVSAVPGETYTVDNTYIGGAFEEVIRGDVDCNSVINILDIATVAKAYDSSTIVEDINHDGVVDETDITIVGFAFGSAPGHLRWNPDADIDDSGKIDQRDAARVGKYFGWMATPNWNANADWDNNRVINILDIATTAKNYGKTA
jgi:parallel beta-helix repeat protein